MRVRDGLRRTCVSIDADATIHQAAVLMEARSVGSLVVLDRGSIAGIVTDRDLVRRAMAKSLESDARVDSVMSAPVRTIDADSDLNAAFSIFRSQPIRRLVATSAGVEPLGVLTIDDLLIDVASQLSDLVRPVTAEAIFAQHDAPVPAAR